jgi:hypothetical protein
MMELTGTNKRALSCFCIDWANVGVLLVALPHRKCPKQAQINCSVNRKCRMFSTTQLINIRILVKTKVAHMSRKKKMAHQIPIYTVAPEKALTNCSFWIDINMPVRTTLICTQTCQ